MRTYNDEPLLAAAAGRMIPSDNRYPECECQLVLTEENLHVLEDHLDGTFTPHFVIPLPALLTLGNYAQEVGRAGAQAASEGDAVHAVAAMVAGALTGMYAYSGRKGAGARATNHLRVSYREGEEKHVLFFECPPRYVTRMEKALRKYKERRVL